ncbi:MAG TPA: UDP-N-acetylmuramoyl-L-alanine--D-glutamate ligase [Thermodesulfobacteriota bacterium]|nr:UDP-N-acetylmuramoyl-L-alanine--D-glutamate ligase [Thermodesulfobacteriota bacterium]
MELRDRKVLVVGVGKTGMETVKFLLAKGADVSVSDSSPSGEIARQVKTLEDWGVRYETGGHSSAMFLSSGTIVLSPGVPFGIPQVREAIAGGIEVISEVELASRFIRKPTIAVTGSNGKTTTSTLIARILEKNGRRVFLGANIGTPLIQIAGDSARYDVLVLELSSFQLQGIETFRPEVSVILNVTPNHLDHHASFEEYARSKMKIFMNQTPHGWCIYKSDDPVIAGYVPEIKASKIPFGVREGEGGVSYDGRGIKYGTDYYDLSGMKLRGLHNVENVMAAVAATKVMGCDPRLIREAVLEFDPLPHRIEYVGEINGAKFYNDSKSTSPDATLRALESLPAPIILIAGGKDKGVSFEPLRDAIEKKVKLMVLMGESRFRMEKDLGGKTDAALAASLEEAVEKTLERVLPGDNVLFSPACSSFDMFRSYEERGRRYKEIVRHIQLI